MEIKNDDYCFGCGKDNPSGLKLDFQRGEGIFRGEFIPQREHQGYPGMTHGGIIAALLDEVMANNLFSQGVAIVTAEISIRYIHKVPIGEKIFLYSQEVNRKKQLYEMEGWLEDINGRVLARGFAKMLSVK